MKRRQFVIGAASLAGLRLLRVQAQERAVPVSAVFGRTYLDFLDYGDLDGLSCDAGDHATTCTSDLGMSLRMLPMPTSETPIFRVSLEQVGGQSVESIRHKALRLAPNDSVTVSEETWADGSVASLFNSPWLAAQFPDNPGLWAGHPPGTWVLVVQMKYGQDTTARAVVSLPQAALSIETIEPQLKGGDREGFDVRAYIDPGASIEGRILAVERALYETQAQNPTSKFGTLFAYREGEALDGLFSVARAAVSTDGNGFLEKSFLIMEDQEGALQVEIKTGDLESEVYLLAV